MQDWKNPARNVDKTQKIMLVNILFPICSVNFAFMNLKLQMNQIFGTEFAKSVGSYLIQKEKLSFILKDMSLSITFVTYVIWHAQLNLLYTDTAVSYSTLHSHTCVILYNAQYTAVSYSTPHSIQLCLAIHHKVLSIPKSCILNGWSVFFKFHSIQGMIAKNLTLDSLEDPTLASYIMQRKFQHIHLHIL